MAQSHRLATAYCLGRNFGIANVAVIEKDWLSVAGHSGVLADMSGFSLLILSKAPLGGVNCGWGTGGFKSIPGSGCLTCNNAASDH